MARTKGAKNKPRNLLVYESLPDVLSPGEAAKWLRTSRSQLLKKVYTGEIPKDCYFMVGSHHKFVKNKLAILFGIRSESGILPELQKQESGSMERDMTIKIIEEGLNLLGLYLSKFKFSLENMNKES